MTRKGEIRRLKVQQSPLIFGAFLLSFHWPQDFATNNILLMYNRSRTFVLERAGSFPELLVFSICKQTCSLADELVSSAFGAGKYLVCSTLRNHILHNLEQ